MKDYTDMDYIKYNVDIILEKDPEQQQEMMRNRMNKLPTIKIPNYIFRNEGALKFSDKTNVWGLGDPVVSAGAAYADLDNDGDLDIIISNCNEIAGVYKNNLRKLDKDKRYLNIKLNGNGKNPFGLGSKVSLVTSSGVQVQEMMPSRGFQSSVDYTLHFGIAADDSIERVNINWSNGLSSSVLSPGTNKLLTINISDAYRDSIEKQPPGITSAFTFSDSLPFKHTENFYNDFNQQGLLPQWFSRQGPAMAKGDINGDNLDDVFIGGAQGQSWRVFHSK